jgi:hypothetical protein
MPLPGMNIPGRVETTLVEGPLQIAFPTVIPNTPVLGEPFELGTGDAEAVMDFQFGPIVQFEDLEAIPEQGVVERPKIR